MRVRVINPKSEVFGAICEVTHISKSPLPEGYTIAFPDGVGYAINPSRGCWMRSDQVQVVVDEPKQLDLGIVETTTRQPPIRARKPEPIAPIVREQLPLF